MWSLLIVLTIITYETIKKWRHKRDIHVVLHRCVCTPRCGPCAGEIPPS